MLSHSDSSPIYVSVIYHESCYNRDTSKHYQVFHVSLVTSSFGFAVCRLTQTGGGPHHGVEPRRDAVGSHLTPLLEQEPVVVIVGQLLHGDAHDAPCDGADGHAGDEQTRRHLEETNTGRERPWLRSVGQTQPSCGLEKSSGDHLESEGEDGHDDLEDERQAELPHGGVDAGPRRPVGVVSEGLTAVHLAAVLAQLRGLERAAVGEQLLDQLAGVLPRVRVGERHHGGDGGHQDDLQHRVLAWKKGGGSRFRQIS